MKKWIVELRRKTNHSSNLQMICTQFKERSTYWKSVWIVYESPYNIFAVCSMHGLIYFGMQNPSLKKEKKKWTHIVSFKFE